MQWNMWWVWLIVISWELFNWKQIIFSLVQVSLSGRNKIVLRIDQLWIASESLYFCTQMYFLCLLKIIIIPAIKTSLFTFLKNFKIFKRLFACLVEYFLWIGWKCHFVFVLVRIIRSVNWKKECCCDCETEAENVWWEKTLHLNIFTKDYFRTVKVSQKVEKYKSNLFLSA